MRQYALTYALTRSWPDFATRSDRIAAAWFNLATLEGCTDTNSYVEGQGQAAVLSFHRYGSKQHSGPFARPKLQPAHHRVNLPVHFIKSWMTMRSIAVLPILLPATMFAGLSLVADRTQAQNVFSEARWGLTIGGFAGFAPAYEGSDEYRFVGYPLIIPKYYAQGYDSLAAPRVVFKGIDDVRMSALRFGNVDVGPVVGYSFGRDEDLSDQLTGLGDVDGGLNAGGFVAVRFAPLFMDAAFVKQVTGDGDLGHTLRFGAGWEDNLTDRLTARAYLSTAYASSDYMNAYFSVTPAQATASSAGLSIYDADAGFKNVALDIGVDYALTERWTLSSKLGYSRIIGDAADSPIVTAQDQFSGGLGLSYTFGRTD